MEQEKKRGRKRRGRNGNVAMECSSCIITVLLDMAFSPKPQKWEGMRESMDPTRLAGLQLEIPAVTSLLATSVPIHPMSAEAW